MTGSSLEGLRERFQQTVGFPLDGFQHRAMDAIDRGGSVLVSAPTGQICTALPEK